MQYFSEAFSVSTFEKRAWKAETIAWNSGEASLDSSTGAGFTDDEGLGIGGIAPVTAVDTVGNPPTCSSIRRFISSLRAGLNSGVLEGSIPTGEDNAPVVAWDFGASVLVVVVADEDAGGADDLLEVVVLVVGGGGSRPLLPELLVLPLLFLVERGFLVLRSGGGGPPIDPPPMRDPNVFMIC
jgi:hypothetical protein